MATDSNTEDDDVPDSGAVFAFGRSKFANNLTNKFWIKNDPVTEVACGDEHSAVVTASGRLYTFGSNDWGQLGHGNNKPYYKPGFVRGLKHEVIQLVACGRAHTIAATSSGRLYGFGAGGEGQLGLDDLQNYSSPKLMEGIGSQDYALVCCGTEHSAALTKQGALYVWGSNSDGQLGLGTEDDCGVPTVLDAKARIKHASCGYYHTAIVTEDGRLFVCGENDSGKLGLSNNENACRRPTLVSAIDEPVESVSCGNSHSAICTASGRVFTFGEGPTGQLGLATATLSSSQPMMIRTSFKFTGVWCGESHTACVTDDGQLLTFGDGRHGKLGHGQENSSNVFSPACVQRLGKFKVKKVACGGCHMLVIAVPNEDKGHNGVEHVSSGLGSLGLSVMTDSADASLSFSSMSQSVISSSVNSARYRRRSRDMSQGPLSPLQPIGRPLPPLAPLNASEGGSGQDGEEKQTAAMFVKPKLPDISVGSKTGLAPPPQLRDMVEPFNKVTEEDVPEVSEESGLSESEDEEEGGKPTTTTKVTDLEKQGDEEEEEEEEEGEEEEDEEDGKDNEEGKWQKNEGSDERLKPEGNGKDIEPTGEDKESESKEIENGTDDTTELEEKPSKLSKLFFWRKKKKTGEGKKGKETADKQESQSSSVCLIL